MLEASLPPKPYRWGNPKNPAMQQCTRMAWKWGTSPGYTEFRTIDLVSGVNMALADTLRRLLTTT